MSAAVAIALLLAAGCAGPSRPSAPRPASDPTPTAAHTSRDEPDRASQPVEPSCRESRYADMWSEPDDDGTYSLADELDVDGDGVPDRLAASNSGGSGYAETRAELSLSGSGVSITAVAGASFDQMVAFHRVPRELAEPGMAGARALIEEALFTTICPGPDPSLRRLLDNSRLEWVDGQPTIAPSYAVYSSDPAVITLAGEQGVAGEEGEVVRAGEPVWVEYHSHNHRRAADLKATGELHLADATDTHELWVTAHGAVVVDQSSQRHAWVYVYPGGRKLRFPSVAAAHFDGDEVVIDLEPTAGEMRVDPIRIRL